MLETPVNPKVVEPPATPLASGPSRSRWRPGSTLLIIIGLALVTAYYVATGTTFAVFMLNTTLLFCIGALALDLLMGTAGQVSIGNAAFLAAGAFAAVWATEQGMAFPLDVIFAAAVCAAIGFVVGLPALRIRGIYLALATLAAFYVVIFFAERYQSDTVGSGAFVLKPVFSGSIEEVGHKWAWTLLCVVAACLILMSWLRSGRSGRAWRMVRDHEVAAPIMGIPVARYKLIAFVISSALIGVQGALSAHFVGSVSADTFTLALSISVIAAILIGGLDSQAGPLIGAAIITTLPTSVPDLMNRILGSTSASSNSSAYAQVAYGILIIVFIVFSPHGINGWFASLGHGIRKLVRRRSEGVPT